MLAEAPKGSFSMLIVAFNGHLSALEALCTKAFLITLQLLNCKACVVSALNGICYTP